MKKKTIYKILTAIFTAVLTAFLPFTVAKQKKSNNNVTLTTFDTWEQLNGDNMYYDFLTEVLDIQFSKTQTTEPQDEAYTFYSDDLMILRFINKNIGNNYVDMWYGFNGGYNSIEVSTLTNNTIFVGVGTFYMDITQYEGIGTINFKLYKVKNIAQMLATAQDLGYYNGYTNGYGDGVNAGGGLTPEDVEQAYTSGYNTGYSSGLTDGYDSGYTNGYDNGYNKGNTDGYGLGLSQGYNDGLTEGYNNGYNDGVAYTTNETNASMNFLQTFFNTIWAIINTKILGFISIGTILLFILGMGVVGLLFKLLKG